MPTTPDPTAEGGTCFVVMGFGKKTDFETGRVLDLDQSYLALIKPAVEAAGLKCIRADEIVHSGLIGVPMYDQLLKADVVVADVSTSNRNALYELGVRHGLRPYTTLIIAEEQMMKSPNFDLGNLVIRQYRHWGEDISPSEAKRFTSELTDAIRQIMAIEPTSRWDSPVYKFIDRLTPPSISPAASAAVAAASATENVAGAATPVHSELMERVEAAQRKGDWLKAKMLLEEIREMRRTGTVETSAGQQVENREDPYILQRLALATYKSKYPTPEEALKAARDLLKLLEPQTSNDTETLGLWAAVHKSLWELTEESSYLDEAVRGYGRGFSLRKDYYNAINYAFMLNVRAAVNTADSEKAGADVAEARRAYQEVVQICNQWLESNPRTGPLPPGHKFPEKRYWVLAARAEAHFGLGENDVAEQRLQEAYAAAPEEWMKQVTKDQLAKLRELLTNSPSNRRFRTIPPAGREKRESPHTAPMSGPERFFSPMIIDTIEGCEIRLEDGPDGEKVTFTAYADISADGANGQNGARAAYMADDSGSELLANGGMGIRHGEAVGTTDWFKDIVVVEGGKPKVFPGGVIVSKTAYLIRGEPDNTPKRYVDSETVPYVVVPPVIIQKTQGVVRGCFARVTYKGKSVDCMVGDVGPRKKIGAVSIAAARAVGMNPSPRSGGEERKIVQYEVFPGRKATINGVAYPLMRSDGTYVD